MHCTTTVCAAVAQQQLAVELKVLGPRPRMREGLVAPEGPLLVVLDGERLRVVRYRHVMYGCLAFDKAET